MKNMRLVNVWIPKGDVERLDELVNKKLYPSRNEAIRFAIHDLLRKEGENMSDTTNTDAYRMNK